jgi:hypothetical protein
MSEEPETTERPEQKPPRKRPLGMFLRLHPRYRATLEACRRQNRRTVKAEVETALIAWFKKMRMPFEPPTPEEDAEFSRLAQERNGEED